MTEHPQAFRIDLCAMKAATVARYRFSVNWLWCRVWRGASRLPLGTRSAQDECSGEGRLLRSGIAAMLLSAYAHGASVPPLR